MLVCYVWGTEGRDGHGVDHRLNHMYSIRHTELKGEQEADRWATRLLGDGDDAHKASRQKAIKYSDLNNFYSQPDNPTNT